jgi:hypothetical protein
MPLIGTNLIWQKLKATKEKTSTRCSMTSTSKENDPGSK